jgi:hypothetical protein
VQLLLRALAIVEPVTLALLLINVSALHVASLAAAVGPVHGACYLGIIVVALLLDGLRPRDRLLALVPGVGGLLVDRAHRSQAVRPS